MRAFLCSEQGHPATPTNVDVGTEGTSLLVHRESRNKQGYTTYRPTWLDMTIEDALRLRQELNRVLRGRKAPRKKR